MGTGEAAGVPQDLQPPPPLTHLLQRLPNPPYAAVCRSHTTCRGGKQLLPQRAPLQAPHSTARDKGPLSDKSNPISPAWETL